MKGGISLAQIEVQIAEDGITSVLVVSTVEDLWNDYQHFSKMASEASVSRFEEKRYLRTALIVLVAYCGAVADKWCSVELKKDMMSGPDIEHWLRNFCFEKKCTYLIESAQKRQRIQAKELNYKFKALRNRIIHVRIGDDLNLYHDLTQKVLHQAESEMLTFFDEIGAALGMERHVNTEEIADSFSKALGTAVDSASF